MSTDADILMPHADACAICHRSYKTLDRWAEAGIIPQPLIINGRKYHNPQKLKEAIAALPAKRPSFPVHLRNRNRGAE
jgi:predicted site-specific integrase-resolvase